jgi:hypothetical protein
MGDFTAQSLPAVACGKVAHSAWPCILCLQPFLSVLEQSLPGVRIGQGNCPVSVVAYADDVTVFLTSVADFPAVEDATRLFEKASGALLNPRKSQALAIGLLNASDTILGITYHPYMRILGVQFWSTSINAKWTQLTGQVLSHAKDSYPHALCLAHRILYVHIYLLAKIRYVAQVFPAPDSASNN